VTEPKYLKPADVAALLSVSKPTVMRLIKTQGLPVHRLGERVYRFELGEVRAWMAEQRKRAG
jgi:excisionase family DNA binding protein